MDTFIEKIVSQRKTPVNRLKSTGIILLAIVVIAVELFFLTSLLASSGGGGIAVLVAAATGFGAWWLVTSMNLEFEYIITNMDFDIDRIVARRRRKRVLSVKSKDFEMCARRSGFDYQEYAKGTFKLLDFSSDPRSGDCWFLVAQYKGERVMVLFDPDERMIEAFRRFNPSRVRSF